MFSGADEPEYIEYNANEHEELTAPGETEDEFVEVDPEN